jgi:hypothetical protein
MTVPNRGYSGVEACTRKTEATFDAQPRSARKGPLVHDLVGPRLRKAPEADPRRSSPLYEHYGSCVSQRSHNRAIASLLILQG